MTGARVLRGAKARRDGRRAEWLCAAVLMVKGYRLLGFRLRSPLGEIDLLAAKAGVVAVVEVKRRRTLDEALGALSFKQRERLRRAARAAVARHPRLKDAPIRLDLIALAPGRWPRHIADAWRDGA